jgi:methyl-accepting chemotaxis protein
MLKNVKVNTMLFVTAVFISVVVLIVSVITYKNVSEIRDLTHENRTEILPYAFNFLNLKLDVIQVQQWLTDISATQAHEGFDDGFGEAETYFHDGNKILDHLISEHAKYEEPEMVNELKDFKTDFEGYYNIGIKMANAYIKGGPIEGNKVMGELDPFAEKLATRLQEWIEEHRAEND